MKFSVLVFTLIICLDLTYSICLGSKLKGEYDVLTKQWVGTAEIDNILFKNISIGFNFKTTCSEARLKAFVPSFVPELEGFETWIQYRVNPTLCFRITDWCDHWFRQVYSTYEDRNGLRLGFEWEF